MEQSGATLGPQLAGKPGETRGNEGNRRDAKPQLRDPFTLILPGSEGAPIGLENRKSRKGLPGSNPGPPANYLRFRGPSARPWGRIGATTGGIGGSPDPQPGSVSVARRHELEAGGPAVEDQTVRRDRRQTACAWLVGIRGRQREAYWTILRPAGDLATAGPGPDTGNSGSIRATPGRSTHPANRTQEAAGRPAQRRRR